MKVIFKTLGSTKIPVEVGDSGSLKEMKEQVEIAIKIPIWRQILSFNGKILRHDVDLLDVVHGSVIDFRVADDPDAEAEAEAEIITLQLPVTPSHNIIVKTCGGDTFGELKKKFQSKEGTPPERILITNEEGVEIPDDARVRDYLDSLKLGLVTVDLMSCKGNDEAPPTPAVDADADVLLLALKFRGEILPELVEVRRSSMVKELRAKLEEMRFKVPKNGIVFFLGRDLLDDYRSFASQNVAHRDVIRIHSPGDNKRKRLLCVS